MPNFVQFRELERVRKQDSDIVVVYEGVVLDTHFAYLYVNSATYTFVWNGPRDFRFNDKQPYTLIKLQFSYMSQAEIDLIHFVLPERRPRQASATGGRPHFYYTKSAATLILAVEAEQRLVEFDLLDREEDRQEYVENIKKPEYVSALTFARYDSEIVSDKYGQVNYCFTAEQPRDVAANGWEFAINLPRKSVLTKRVLRWVAKNHQAAGLMHRLDFEQARGALKKILNLQDDLVFSEARR